MTKPASSFPRPLADLLRKTLNEGFARQGFASSEIVTRWAEIIGSDIAQHCEPIKIQWPRGPQDDPQPATLVLRVEGPAALEIQHMSGVILERVNRFFGWHTLAFQAASERLGELVKLLVVQERERLQRRVGSNPARACAESIRHVKHA